MARLAQNPYEAHPRRSLRNAGNRSSNSSQNRSTGSNRSGTYDSSIDESDSFEYNSRDASLNSDVLDRQEGRFQQYERFDDISEEDEPMIKRSPKPKSSDSGASIWIVFVILAFLVIAGAYWYRSKNPFEMQSTERVVCSKFKELDKKFSRQERKLWLSLKVGIENMLNNRPPQPNVFLLAYNDPNTSKNVMASILNVTASCMKSNDPIKLHGGTFVNDSMLEDYGIIIETYREQLEREGIMYVSNLHEIPGRAAQAFHTICDTITPFVEKSIIFFTLYVDQYDEKMPPKKLHELVEATLEHKWSDINKDTLKALIGRVTDQVFLIHSENDIH